MEDLRLNVEGEVSEAVRSFIIKNFLFGEENQAPGGDASFLETGIIDSTGILEVVMFIETTYGIEVSDHEMIPENLDSMDNISAFVGRKINIAET